MRQQQAAPRRVYVLGSEDRFLDGRVDRLLANGLTEAFRIDPVFTNKTTCENGEEVFGDKNLTTAKAALGILLAHRNAWSAIANQSERALVLESDFSVGEMEDDELRAQLDSAWARQDEVLTNVGWCDVCPTMPATGQEAAQQGCAWCATGYLLAPSLARILVEHAGRDVCMATDLIFSKICMDGTPANRTSSANPLIDPLSIPPPPPPPPPVFEFQLQLGLRGPVNCSFDDLPPRDGGFSYPRFHGIFQQDLIRYAGSHWTSSGCARDEATGELLCASGAPMCEPNMRSDGHTPVCSWHFRSGSWTCLDYPCAYATCERNLCGPKPTSPGTEGQLQRPPREEATHSTNP